MLRRPVLSLFLALPLLAALTPTAEARCARIELGAEVARSRYVFEGELLSVSGTQMTFAVTAVWKGDPPARLVVTRSRRGGAVREADVGRAFLIFAVGDTMLSFHRCGSSRLIDGAAGLAGLATELAALGLTRVAR